jgi:hypothetical protein
LLPLLCKEGRGEVEGSTPPSLPLQRGGNGVVVAPLTKGREIESPHIKERRLGLGSSPYRREGYYESPTNARRQLRVRVLSPFMNSPG